MQKTGVKSALRTFEVLELFKEQRRPLRLNEIHTALDYPQSSATNLLKSMVVTGYLNYNRRNRTYMPTMRVSDLGGWLPSFIYTDGDLQALVDRVAQRSDETVALVTQNDLFIQYAILRTPAHEHKAPPAQGTQRLLVDSSSGLAILSGMPDRAIDKLYRYSRYHYPELEYFRSFEDLMAEIRWVRFIGHAYLPRRPTPETGSVAVSLKNNHFGIPLAIGIGGLHTRIHARKNELLAILQEEVFAFHQLHETAAQVMVAE